MVSQAQARTVEQETAVAVSPRGLVVGVALSLPLWGGIALVAHAAWTLLR